MKAHTQNTKRFNLRIRPPLGYRLGCASSQLNAHLAQRRQVFCRVLMWSVFLSLNSSLLNPTIVDPSVPAFRTTSGAQLHTIASLALTCIPIWPLFMGPFVEILDPSRKPSTQFNDAGTQERPLFELVLFFEPPQCAYACSNGKQTGNAWICAARQRPDRATCYSNSVPRVSV